MSINGRKLNRYLGELESIYQQSVNLTVNYNHAINIIAQTRNEVREIGLDRNYINITEHQLYTNHQVLMLELNALNVRLQAYRTRPLTVEDHMQLLVLGEELTNWNDKYTGSIIAVSMDIMNHIQNVYFQLEQNTKMQGAVHV